MRGEAIQDPGAFAQSLGRFHDVEINGIEIDTSEKVLRLKVDDLNANFTETSEYEGCRRCSLVFLGVREFGFDIDNREGIRITDAFVTRKGREFTLVLDLNLGGGSATEGRGSIRVGFKEMRIVDDG